MPELDIDIGPGRCGVCSRSKPDQGSGYQMHAERSDPSHRKFVVLDNTVGIRPCVTGPLTKQLPIPNPPLP